MRSESGVTLIELVATVGIVAIVATVGVPLLNHLHYNAQRTTAVNNFFHALFLARSEAILRGQVVSLCRSVDQRSCASDAARWGDGWMVFVNDDRDDPAVRDEGEEILKAYEAWPQGTIRSNRATYSFRPHVQAVVNGTVVFCDPRGSPHARAIIISHTGRPRVAKADSSGKPLSC